MGFLNLQKDSHKRFNPLSGQWVVVSPQRIKRPWRGAEEKPSITHLPRYDASCYLCPGNRRANGEINPQYENTFVFDNDFPGLSASSQGLSKTDNDLFQAENERGICQVLCFSPRHDLTLPLMTLENLKTVVLAWVKQTTHLSSVPWVRYVQIFENKGEMMGCSNPHPHGQIWATESLPNEPQKEMYNQERYLNQNNFCLLCQYIEQEQARSERIVVETDHHIAVVPFWAVWPFEVLLLPKNHIQQLTAYRSEQIRDLAQCLKLVTTRFDNLFKTSFPYCMGFHQAPFDGISHPEWHLHTHFYPPLLRSASIRKFMVGFEMLGTPQRDLTPEEAAKRLRELPDEHFRVNS